MLHCHVASVPAYTHFLSLSRHTADSQNVSLMYTAFTCGGYTSASLFPNVYYWAVAYSVYDCFFSRSSPVSHRWTGVCILRWRRANALLVLCRLLKQ